MTKLNLEVAAFFSSLLCFTYMLTAKRKQYKLNLGIKNTLMNQHFVYMVTVFSIIVSSVSSVGALMLQPIASDPMELSLNILHTCFFLSHNFLPMGFALYILHFTGSSGGKSRRFFILFFLPFFIAEAMTLTNGLTHWVFFLDESFSYHRGSGMFFFYACGILYFLLGVVFFFRHKKAISKGNSYTIGILLALSGAGVVIQAINSKIAVELFFESLSAVGILMMLEERSGHIDPLTGAYNRVALVDNARRLIETNQNFRIVLIKLTDIDLFQKLFNGREMDSLLLQISEYLSFVASNEQRLYYFRTYDFAILYSGSSVSKVEDTVNTILKRFSDDWKSGGASFKLEAIVSILRIPEDITTVNELTDLLTAGYRKTGLGSRVVTYEEISSNQRNRKIEKALREAVDSEVLRLYFQPIWSVDEQRTVAAEALLRIDSDALRKLSPAVYIPIAEQCGVIREIGLFVFEDVCRFLKSMKRHGIDLSYIELNLSVHQFIYDDLVERFESIRKKYDIPTEMINLEITESASIEDTPNVEKTINALRELGYSFSLDDFGTGYSTLTQFLKTSYKNVKIDKSLLWDSDTNEVSAKLLDALIHMVRSLGCNVVQEGVETSEQLERTEASGGNLIQGYYFSKPLPQDEFVEYLKREKESSGSKPSSDNAPKIKDAPNTKETTKAETSLIKEKPKAKEKTKAKDNPKIKESPKTMIKTSIKANA